MSYATPMADPIYEGSGVTTLVPDSFDCALNGRPYMIDWKYAAGGEFFDESIRLLKPQQDTSGQVSEASLNPEDFPRHGIESWHKGAGQTHLNRADSDPDRFRSSKGWNVWERWELSLLPDTDQKKSSANTNLHMAVAGAYLGLIDGSGIHTTQDVDADTPTWQAVTNSGGTPVSITSDGYYFYVTDGADIYRFAKDATTTGAAWSTYDSDLLGYVKGRLMSGHDNVASNITAAAAKTDVVTHPNSDFRWVGFAEIPGFILMAGYSGDKSLIYRTAIKADGTALDTGVVAGELPDGEIVRAIKGYLGFVLIGTDKGIRLAIPDSSGNLTIGALIELDVAVRCFEGQGRFVWFGWTNYDSSSTGLGRLDLTVLNGSAPAYASDLMVTGQGNVLDIVTFDNHTVFTVSGLGVYADDDDMVASATIDSGLITFGLPDDKVGMYVDLRHEPLAGSVALSISNDGGDFQTLVTSDEADSTELTTTAGQATATTFELRMVGARDAVTTTGPTVTRLTLEANPAPGRGEFFTVPLLLWETVDLANGLPHEQDPAAEKAALVAMEVSGQPITFQDGVGSETVLLDDHRFVKHSYTSTRRAYNGTFLARLRRPRQRS